jgi:peptidoglycan/xylan/chitin deacetylase (PgdA/CDA1 family)
MGHEIGAHSRTHPQLDTLPTRAVRREVAGSQAELQDRTGLPIAGFAYPHGYSDARVRRVVRDAGFTSACSVKNALSPPHDRLFSLARLMVMSTTTDAELDGWLAGRGVPVGQADERLLTVGWRWYRRARATVAGAPGWSDAA